MKITLNYRQYDIYGRTSQDSNGTFSASGEISQPDPAGTGSAFEVAFKTDAPFLTDEAAHSGGTAYAKKLIDGYWMFGHGTVTHVLLVEDNPGDARLMRESFVDARRPIKLHVAVDGLEAMAFLRHEGNHVNAPRPDIILLDLNMPLMDGREVLDRIKRDESLKTIPTLVLTTSDLEQDIVQSYQLQANCYLRKPGEWDAFDNVVRSINDFWLTKVQFPQH